LSVPVVHSVFPAVWKPEMLELAMVPAASYWSVLNGHRNVRPLRRLPATIAPVFQRMNAPTPAAYTVGPVADTAPGSESLQPPVRVPVALSNTSPLVGNDQVSPVGYELRIVWKKARIAASAPETLSREWNTLTPGRPVAPAQITSILRVAAMEGIYHK
jgi:hypothetical protein